MVVEARGGSRPATNAILDALDDAYGDLSAVALGLDEDASWAPTRCPGWVVRDLVHHLLADAQRILVALATPTDRAADVDVAGYWRGAPGAPDRTSAGIRAERALASQWSLDRLCSTYAETAAAVRVAARRVSPTEVVATQGHALTVDDLLSTAVTEAAIHHLDLRVWPGPRDAPLAVARRTLDELLGRTTPEHWPSADWVLAGSGRSAPGRELADWLGADAVRLPLLR